MFILVSIIRFLICQCGILKAITCLFVKISLKPFTPVSEGTLLEGQCGMQAVYSKE